MSQADQGFTATLFVAALLAVVLSATATAAAVREESKAGAWIGLVAFLSSSLLVAWFLWRLL